MDKVADTRNKSGVLPVNGSTPPSAKAKVLQKINNTIDAAVIAIIVVILLFCLYSIIDAVYLYYSTNPAITHKFTDEDGNIIECPKDAIAWITIDDTPISYPVMQGKTNDEYLGKDPFGNSALSGSIFLDSRNNKNWKDEYNLLYGHHASSGQMFGILDKYKETEFFYGHRTGTLRTNDADYELEIFAIVDTHANEPVLFNAGNNVCEGDINEYIRPKSLIYAENTNKHLLALSTCQDGSSTRRLVVIASMKETASPGTLPKVKEEAARNSKKKK